MGLLRTEDQLNMSNSISTLLTRNLQEVFDENDPTRRRAAVQELYTEDGVFYDPSRGAYRGRDEIDRIAGEIRATHLFRDRSPLVNISACAVCNRAITWACVMCSPWGPR